VARRFSRRREKLDLDFFVRRIRQAHELRQQWTLDRDPGRLVWSESDGLPGLIVDRYGSNLVIQTLTVAMDQRKELVVQALDSLFSPTSIIERNDAPVRRAEGMELKTSVLKGEAPPRLTMSIAGMDFELELLSGQKTGFYLDQIDNYNEVAQLASGKRVLDCFANQGAFAIACAKNGAESVTAVEISEPLAAAIETNARLNHVSLTVYPKNVFDFLTEQVARQESYDLIVLDPPSFTRSRETLEGARRGYKEIHLRAIQLLAPQGLLVTFSCSHHISQSALSDIVVDASVDARRHLRRIKSLSQPLDHPILPHLPETEYLKGFVFQLLPGR
jgi:23S rRNA (cytosine1962-C5)-methyltransferase